MSNELMSLPHMNISRPPDSDHGEFRGLPPMRELPPEEPYYEGQSYPREGIPTLPC